MIDLTTGRPLPHHERGEICARGPHIMKGYLKNVKATRDMIDPEGWLHTGRHVTHARPRAPVTSVCAKTHNRKMHAQMYAYGRTRDTTVFDLTYSSIIGFDHHTEPSDSFWPVLQSIVRRSKQNGASPPFNFTNNVDNVNYYIGYIM